MSEPSLSMRFKADGPVIEAPPTTPEHDRSSWQWQCPWEELLSDVVSEMDPWGLLGQRPDMDVMLFDVTPEGIHACAQWATAVRLVIPDWGDDE